MSTEGKTLAYLINLIDEQGGIVETSRILVDFQAWNYIRNGGRLPQKIKDDAEAQNEDRTEQIELRDRYKKYEDERERFRAHVCVNSSFNGEFCKSDSIMDLIEFVTRHNLHIAEEETYSNYDP